MQASAHRSVLFFWISLVFGIALIVGVGWRRAQRVEFVSGLAAQPVAKPTGDNTIEHRLIIPGHTNESFQWILETEALFREGHLRLRHTSQDNAPSGRNVHSPSPYRWWLASAAWIDHFLRSTTSIAAVETASIWADPALLIFALIVGALVLKAIFGARTGILFSLGIAFLFPFTEGFIPGAPDHHGLAWLLAFGSVAGLPAGCWQSRRADAEDVVVPALRNWFVASAIFGAAALWVDVSIEAPILLGVAFSALLTAWVQRRSAASVAAIALPWLSWGVTGAIASLAFYCAESAPDLFKETDLRVLHPLYALAWLGLAMVIGTLSRILCTRKAKPSDYISSLLGLAAVAAFPIVAHQLKSSGFWATDLLSYRLTKLPSDVSGNGLWAWLLRTGPTLKFFATVLIPIFAVGLSIWRLRDRHAVQRAIGCALVTGPLAIVIVYSFYRLSWWNLAGYLAILTICIATTEPDPANAVKPKTPPSVNAALWTALVAMLPGAIIQFGVIFTSPRNEALEDTDLTSLIERDLAHYLQTHADASHAIVLAPPGASVALYYYGGLRGLGSLFWENVDGVSAAVRILSASTIEEAQALIEKREVSYIIVPTWDETMNQYARVGSGQLEGTFLNLLHQWSLPNWLRPVTYTLPTVAGFENQYVSVFKFEPQQNDALALSRLCDYFIDVGKPELAVPIAQNLRKYPADLGAIVTRAEVALSTNDQETLTSVLQSISSRLTHGGDRFLPFDRRVDLAVILARTQQSAAAKDQVQKCMMKIDASKIRSLSIGSLYRLQLLEKVFDLRISDPELYQLARDLLTPDLRAKL